MAELELGLTRTQLMNILVEKRGWWKEIGLTEDQGNNYRTRLKKGKLSVEKIEEILKLAGYEIVQVELWAKK